ncbi:glycoside hydrolase [Pararcticibacter amylolyticus]|uniref:Beta-glycosidase n=1 Tax=Pararcticibacter amylolyticus TaxID=2173175 RepID=A0A2U2PAF2_9SPHI|nr:glycoside hydrolase [Pararcticibacter amylolyticus]PWG78371.1 beta-glycosidase [Pararcticibacter amylolyticus]
MNIKQILLLVSAIATGCNKAPAPTIAPDTRTVSNGEEKVVIDITKKYQTIESFAASDCWYANYIGNSWSDSEREGIAKLLFSKRVENGQPEGIGLSGWRFNLGGGTAQQGAASDIEDISRRAEAFIDPVTGSIDWTKQAGQQYFLNKAKSYGCEQFVMFSNTPPVNFTRNGKGYSGMGAYSNLKDEHYDDFAEYMASVLQHFNNNGTRFDYISPVNEPQHNWNEPGQEGTAWQNSEIKKLTVELDKAIKDKGLNTKILLAESAAWNDVYEADGDPGRKNVISNLFNSASSNYVGNLEHVAPVIAGHSYWTDGTWQSLVSTRTKVDQSAKAAGLKAWQTEWSMLGDGYSENEFPGFDKASYMDIALYMSKVINCDLVYANVSSWSYWTALSAERWGHKNRFLLIKVTPAGGDYGDIRQSGTHTATKTLWVLGNYSLFIRPGYKRVDLQIQGSSKDLFGSAFISPDGKKIVAVYTNLSTQQFDAKALIKDTEIADIKAYTTSASQDMAERTIAGGQSPITVNPGSVVTVVYNLK